MRGPDGLGDGGRGSSTCAGLKARENIAFRGSMESLGCWRAECRGQCLQMLLLKLSRSQIMNNNNNNNDDDS